MLKQMWEEEEAGDFSFLLSERGARDGRAGATSRVLIGRSSTPAESGGGMASAMMLAATLAIKSERPRRAPLHDDSAMMNHNLGLPSRNQIKR